MRPNEPEEKLCPDCQRPMALLSGSSRLWCWKHLYWNMWAELDCAKSEVALLRNQLNAEVERRLEAERRAGAVLSDFRERATEPPPAPQASAQKA